ncbi:hypothetical protein [Metabacillus fastidiosus]
MGTNRFVRTGVLLSSMSRWKKPSRNLESLPEGDGAVHAAGVRLSW